VHADRTVRSEYSRWKDTDFAVNDWYRSVGRSVEFDRVHVVQWDLLFLDAFERAYPALPDNAVALSGLIRLAEIAHFWDWVLRPELAADTNRLFEEARRRFNYRDEPYACLGPGYSLPRAFLIQSSALQWEGGGHDELRIPLLAQVLGF